MSIEQENASVGAPEEEKAETPEAPAATGDDGGVNESTDKIDEGPDQTAPTESPIVEAVAEAPADLEADSDVAPEQPAAPSVEEPAAPVEPTRRSSLPDDFTDDFEAAIEATVLQFREGDIVEGTIVSVDSEGAMVDVGYKSEGLIPTRSSR